MSNPNLGWLFYKDYYNAIGDWTDIEASQEAISNKVDEIIKISSNIEQIEALGNIHFKATTTYPGLILGSGNIHELPSIEGQAILGFHFDYTTGLPVIQGSSIKGVIRSIFPLRDKELKKKLESKKLSSEEKESIRILNNNKKEYLKELIGKDIDIEELEREIFDNGDIFFDATIISKGKILGDDYLAPHGDDPLQNPKPLRFIKILPNIEFRFDFELSDGLLNKEEKALLFGEILYDLGLGAKTNVGYGKFDDKLTKDRLKRQLEDNREEEERITKEKEDEVKKRQEEEKFKSMTLTEMIIEKVKNINDNKEIFDLLNDSNLTQEDKNKIKKHILDKIGEKPSKPKPAKRKWAIKIYEFFGQ